MSATGLALSRRKDRKIFESRCIELVSCFVLVRLFVVVVVVVVVPVYCVIC